jgi:hypothetical protein
MTWQAVHGLEAARAKAAELTAAALGAAEALPDGRRLKAIAEKMLRRTF